MTSRIDGLVLESKFPQLQYVIKGPIQDEWRDGVPVRRPKHIVLEFDRYLLVLDDLGREKEWTDEDKEYIARQLDYELGRPGFVDFWEHKPKLPDPPWPTYNDTHHAQIATVAETVGMVNEALNYEKRGRPGGPRESVVAKLEALQNIEEGSVPFAPDDDALAAV